MAINRYNTAGAIINKASKELGLGTVADPYSSADPNFERLVEMLNSIGLMLLDETDWEHLIRDYSFVTVTNQTPYDLPADYHRMVDQTGWNRTTSFELNGQMSPQLWQARRAQTTTTVFPEFRLTTNQILLAPFNAVIGGETVAFEFVSRAWVRSSASGLGNGNTLGTSGADSCAVSGDYPLYEPLLLQHALKWYWKRDIGADTTTAEEDYIRTLDRVKSRHRGTAALPIAPGPGWGGDRLINGSNLPDGNW